MPDIGNMPDIEMTELKIKIGVEFADFLAKYRQEIDPHADRDRVFQGWVIEWLAGFDYQLKGIIDELMRQHERQNQLAALMVEVHQQVLSMSRWADQAFDAGFDFD